MPKRVFFPAMALLLGLGILLAAPTAKADNTPPVKAWVQPVDVHWGINLNLSPYPYRYYDYGYRYRYYAPYPYYDYGPYYYHRPYYYRFDEPIYPYRHYDFRHHDWDRHHHHRRHHDRH
ncbi:hypothetical protein LLG95_11780 [bacterium]|nr:hypothetical protein [bacterium]